MRFATIDLACAADVSLATFAEDLGLDGFYVGDNPMMWSDPFVTLALAAQQTRRITLGIGVAITGIRPVPLVAQATATLNLIAPGRVSCGVGTGHSAMRVLGHPPMLQRDFEEYVRALRDLLGGGETELVLDGRRTPVHHLPDPRGYQRFDPRPPLYVSGFGPRSLAVAGRHGDGVVGYVGGSPDEIDATWRMIEAGAQTVGRTIDRDRYFASWMGMICVLREGEDADSERIRRMAGPVAMLATHYSYEQWQKRGTPPPEFMEEFWEDYVASLEKVPRERRHLRVHVGHQAWIPEEDERFVTRALIEGTCVVGTPEQVADHVRMLEATGVDEVAITPSPATAREALTDLAEHVIPLVRGVSA